jgi:hypothetical protein
MTPVDPILAKKLFKNENIENCVGKNIPLLIFGRVDYKDNDATLQAEICKNLSMAEISRWTECGKLSLG